MYCRYPILVLAQAMIQARQVLWIVIHIQAPVISYTKSLTINLSSVCRPLQVRLWNTLITLRKVKRVKHLHPHQNPHQDSSCKESSHMMVIKVLDPMHGPTCVDRKKSTHQALGATTDMFVGLCSAKTSSTLLHTVTNYATCLSKENDRSW